MKRKHTHRRKGEIKLTPIQFVQVEFHSLVNNISNSYKSYSMIYLYILKENNKFTEPKHRQLRILPETALLNI